MNKISWRHHYLPRFYLQTFSKENGLIKIYDVKSNLFIKSGKKFSTESYFFEKNGYNIFYNQEIDDFLETNYYKLIDDKISKIYDVISDDLLKITNNDLIIIEHFINIIFWRHPSRKSELLNLINNPNELENIGLIIKKCNKINLDLNDLKLVQSYIPLKLVSTKSNIDFFPKFYKTDNILPYLTCDNPVIFEKDINSTFKSRYIFPLKGNLYLIKTLKNEIEFQNLKFMIDMLLIKQSFKYVTTTDEYYLQSLIEDFENNFKTIDNLKEELWNII